LLTIIWLKTKHIIVIWRNRTTGGCR